MTTRIAGVETSSVRNRRNRSMPLPSDCRSETTSNEPSGKDGGLPRSAARIVCTATVGATAPIDFIRCAASDGESPIRITWVSPSVGLIARP